MRRICLARVSVIKCPNAPSVDIYFEFDFVNAFLVEELVEEQLVEECPGPP